MLSDSYSYKANASHRQYIFESIGPKGRIIKVVLYQLMEEEDGVDTYNLAFGDFDPLTREFSDLATSNNKDSDKVLATGAATALDFTNHFPGSRIYAKRSTPSRTRLYQMGIAANFKEMDKYFLIEGENDDGELLPFLPGVNYCSFLATRR